MKTIIITAVGSMAAPPVIQRYHQLGYRVIGCDIYDRSWNAASMEADDFFQARLSTEGAAYTAQMLDAIARYGADYLIPLTDPEVDALCPLKAAFRQAGCVLCVPDEGVTRLCRMKDKMNAFLDDVAVCRTIPTWDAYTMNPDTAVYPLILKPQSGRSSQGQAIVETPEGFRAAVKARTDYIAQPYLTGPVLTVDTARDAEGNIHTAVRQELLRNPSGLGMTVQVLPNHPLSDAAAEIARAIGLVGVVNMEFIDHGNENWFLEVNPRFSGGVGFSILAGVDFASLMLRCHSGESIGMQPAVKAAVMARKNEIVITKDDSK